MREKEKESESEWRKENTESAHIIRREREEELFASSANKILFFHQQFVFHHCVCFKREEREDEQKVTRD